MASTPTLSNSSNYFNVLSQFNVGNNPSLSSPSLSSDQLYNTIQQANQLLNNYQQSNPISNILEVQTDYNNIMNQEYNYLQQQESKMKQDVETGERMLKLNDSNRKRYYAYISIIMIWVCTIVLVILLVYMNRFLGVPFNFFFAIIVTVAIVWSVWIFYSINIRDPTDYDKLNLDGPNASDVTSTSNWFTEVGAKNNLDYTAPSAFCIGADCCPTVTGSKLHYDAGLNKCVDAFQNYNGGKEGFITLNQFLDYYPPMSISKIFPMTMYNYPCEGDSYCTYRDKS
jgi:uncharacterized membrane protein (DUF485 family)